MRASLLLNLVLALAQSLPLPAQEDSLVLSYDQYMENILRFHPVARKADLKLRSAAANWLSVRGNFDPELDFIWSEKNFDEKLYYRQYGGKFRLPTPLGVELVGGYENAEGVFLNPENTTDPYGLWHLGVEIDLLQGLIVNERKIALQQARVFQEISENEREIILNELLYSASKAYLKWQQTFHFDSVLQENIQIASTYFENTKISFQNGEKAAIDTLEAFIVFQDAVNTKQQNEATLVSDRQKVENYLWFDNFAITLQPGVGPSDYREQLFQIPSNANVAALTDANPTIKSYVNKQSFLEIEQRLKREKLKPKLKAKYNPLLSTSAVGLGPNLSISDVKWGVNFSMPLLFRSEKAEIERGMIKIEETVFDLQSKRNELSNKIENSLMQQAILNEQLALSQQNLEGYRALMDGELEKFRLGESSVFLLNKRQEKYINGRLKLIELSIKLQLQIIEFFYYTNDLIDGR